MPVTVAPPRRLLIVEYAVDGTFTSTSDTAGAALSTAFGGSFTVANVSAVEVTLSIPYTYCSAGDWLRIHLLVDGTPVSRSLHFEYVASVGLPAYMRALVSGLSAGSHTVAVQGSVGSGTGHVLASSGDLKAILTVDESA